VSPIEWTPRHVYGHQDKGKAYANLDRWEQLNCDMDNLAKQHWLTIKNTQQPHFDLPHRTDEWSIWHRGKRLTQWSEKTALKLINTTPSQQYWQQKHDMNRQGPAPAWEALYQAYKSAPTQFKLWTPKWLSGWIPIGKKLK
jgi:hypothetical protein